MDIKLTTQHRGTDFGMKFEQICSVYLRSFYPKTGSELKGWPASCVSTCAAAACPNSAGMVPSTGMVRTRKLGTTCAR